MNRFLFILPLLLADTLYAATLINGRCIEVLDGDTYKAEIVIKGEKQIITVRCNGIDAPEKGQDYGDESREFLSQLILNRPVIMQFEKKDVYNRYLCKTGVKTPCGNILVEKAMLDAGCAWHFVKYSNSAELQSIEDSARYRRVGLWKKPGAQPPWKFREQRKGDYANEELVDDDSVPTKDNNKKPTDKEIIDSELRGLSLQDTASGIRSNHSSRTSFPSYSNVPTQKAKYWYNEKTGVYHIPSCHYYGCPQGIPVDSPRGRPCEKCMP